MDYIPSNKKYLKIPGQNNLNYQNPKAYNNIQNIKNLNNMPNKFYQKNSNVRANFKPNMGRKK